jgi:uncharacterized protein YbjT (DUF2867 family)
MIAVMGASGNVGSRVAARLLAEGRDVRVFGRSADRIDALGEQGADVVVGDAIRPEDLQTLFKDAEAALIVLPDNVTDPHYVANRSAMSRAITDALRGHGVGQIVFASSLGAEHAQGTGQVVGLHQLEELLSGLDADVLALRAAFHMENLLGSIPMIQGQKMNGGVVKADLKYPLIACADIAERAAQRLLQGGFTGHSVETVLGPEDRSMSEATRALGEALGIPGVPYVEFPPEGVKAALQGIGWSEEFASLLVESQIAINEGLITAERTAENTTPTSLEEFLRGALSR